MGNETDYLACLLVCGPPIFDEPYSGSNWPAVYNWYKENYGPDSHRMHGYSFYQNYVKWWRLQVAAHMSHTV